MTTSGTYSYNPSLGELTLQALSLCGIIPTALTQEHMSSAHTAANLMLANWSNRGVNLWEVELVTLNLVTGTSTYSVDPKVIMILDTYVTTTNSGQNVDRIILPISRTEYASYPNKTQQGFPTTYWFDRLISPTITIWRVPNTSTGPSTMSYYAVTQIQDSNYTGGQTIDIPYRWLEAFATGLASRLAMIWAPALVQMLKPAADEAYSIAAQQDTEYVSMYISPQLSGYYR